MEAKDNSKPVKPNEVVRPDVGGIRAGQTRDLISSVQPKTKDSTTQSGNMQVAERITPKNPARRY